MIQGRQVHELDDDELVFWWSLVVRANTNQDYRQEVKKSMVSHYPSMSWEELQSILDEARKQLMEEFKRRGMNLPN